MKPTWKKFAPFGLYLCLAALLVAGGLYIVQHTFSIYIQISLAVAVIGLAAFVLIDPQHTKELLTGRQARYGSNALISVLAVLGILIVVNYLGVQNPKRWDLTSDKANTLAPETIQTLQKMPSKVTATAFFTARTSSDTARTLLDSMKFNSNGKFDYKFVDPESDPVAAKAANITQDGTISLSMNGQTEQVTYVSEQDVDTALIRLTNPGIRGVYFLTGHGEADPDGSGDTSLSQTKQVLTSKNYKVSTLNLMTTATVPADAKVVIIAGPTKPLTQNEVDAIKAFQDKGGSVILFMEPTVLTQYGDAKDPLAAYLDSSWGIKLDEDVIIDPSINPPLVAVADSYGTNAIVDKLNKMATLFPTARSLTVAPNTSSDLTTDKLIMTSSQSYGETDMTALNNSQTSYDQKTDLAGPLTVAVASANSKTKARVVVIGDSDFAKDYYFQRYGNGTLVVNSVDWASDQENLINLTPKSTTTRTMVTPEQTTLGLILLVTIIVIPGLILVLGIFTWIQRKRRG
jgi:ABC-type uncharacterized transport system involved in gliding motility auxiliary subunit